MEKFAYKGREYWENFGKSFALLPRQYFDFVSMETYENFLEKYDLHNKKVIDIGAGYSSPSKESPDKEQSPLSSELQEILEQKDAKIVPLDVAQDPLVHQKEKGRESVLGDAFHLPFKNGSVDGGAIVMNVFNSSFEGNGGKEIFITPDECRQILEEVYRVLQKDAFVIINNYGYILAKIGNQMKFMGPEKDDIITPEVIGSLAKDIGFQTIKKIPLDPERTTLGERTVYESFPEQLRNQISVHIESAGALLIEK